MARKNSQNNDFLNNIRKDVTPKIYNILVELVNRDREDLADHVLKIDYLLTYAANCINIKDFKEARATADRIKVRLDILKENDALDEYLVYLYEGIVKKCK